MPNSFAFVSLLTSDAYLPGTLALAAAIRDVHAAPSNPDDASPFDLVCLVTPQTVDVKSIKLLRRAYTHVVGVEVIEHHETENLRLLGRPDLTHVLTKLHVFRLTEYRKLIFLDADVLPLQPLAHLFSLPHEFAAAPDVGWPDIFNSGMMLLQPGEDKFDSIMSLAKSKGSWDGGDQGILNEWRGNDWHRLSFVYNTTPTAAYTYAPAYKRFGQNIKAIHFIGRNKPWSSMPYRAPFSSQGLASIQSSPATFGYGDLVDRWFAVYDKHYRPQEPTMHETMQETRYESAWNAPQVEAAAPQVLSLEELRRMAVEGTSSAPPPQETQNAPSERFTEPAPHLEPPPTTTQGNVPEGQYRSLPLEGRFDLMPLPPPAPAREAADAGNDAQLTVVHIVAPSQSNSGEHAYIPHPPALDSVALLQSPQARNLDGADYWQAFPQPQPQPPSFETPQERPRSPPLVTWNPAVEPPPSNPPPQTAFRPSTHFENAWDAPKNKGSGAETFFVAPVQTKIPEHLIREGHYSNVVHAAPAFVPPAPAHPAARPREDVRGEPTVVTTPNIVKQQPPAFMELPAPTPQYVDPYRPDKAKVGAVFPWENKPRHVPGRIFPRAASPPPPSSAVYIASTASTPSSPPPVPAPTRPPLVTQGSSGSRSFTNAWDHVPSIQRYAQKLQKPGSVPQPAAAATTAQTSSPKGKRSRRSSSSTYKSWEDAEGSSSHEADVEDEGNDSSDENGSTQSKRQSRRVSRASPLIRDEKTGKAYRSQGVQTIIPVTNEKAVQVSYFEASTDSQGLVNNFASKPPPPPPPGPRRGFPMLPFNHKALLASQELPASPSIDDYPGPQPSNASKIAQAANRSGDQNGVPPGRNIQKPASRSIYQRSSSDTISSSQGPLSPPESQSIPLPMTSVMSPTAQFQTEPMSPTKPAPRIWDPARGVDVFKRESQEVLARFLRMGSWEGPAQS